MKDLYSWGYDWGYGVGRRIGDSRLMFAAIGLLIHLIPRPLVAAWARKRGWL
jgi:hypothetical protein